MAITKIDLKALRSADKVCFRLSDFEKINYRENQGKMQIECIKDVKDDPWNRELYYYVDIDFQVSLYNVGERVAGPQLFHSMWDVRQWETIAKQIKEGDRLIAEWHCEPGETTTINRLYLNVERTLPSRKINEQRYLIAVDARPAGQERYMMVPLITPTYAFNV
jgi:hypothetical protein